MQKHPSHDSPLTLFTWTKVAVRPLLVFTVTSHLEMPRNSSNTVSRLSTFGVQSTIRHTTIPFLCVTTGALTSRTIWYLLPCGIRIGTVRPSVSNTIPDISGSICAAWRLTKLSWSSGGCYFFNPIFTVVTYWGTVQLWLRRRRRCRSTHSPYRFWWPDDTCWCPAPRVDWIAYLGFLRLIKSVEFVFVYCPNLRSLV